MWRNDTGNAIKLSHYYGVKKYGGSLDDLQKGIFSYGLKGSADIMGILKGGKILCVEIKSGNAKQSKVQKNFEKMINSFDGIYIVARSAEEALNFVKHCLDS